MRGAGLLAALAAAAAVGLWLPPRGSAPRRRGGRPTRSGARPAARRLPVEALTGLGAGLAVLALLPGGTGPPVAIVVGVVSSRLVRRMEPAAARRRRAQLAARMPQVVDLMATCLGAGASPAAALGHVADVAPSPMRDELAPHVARLRLGADPTDVWSSLAAHPQLGPLGRSVGRAAVTGGSVAEALTRLAEELRAERRAAVEARARAVEVKTALPLGLCLLPAFVLVGVVPLVAGSFSLTFLVG